MEYDFNITVFCQNEAARIGGCIAGIATASRSVNVCVTVIANGSTDGSAALARHALRLHQLPARVFTIAHGDKANAINQSFHATRPRARLHVFVDGYSLIAADALAALARALDSHPEAVAATGVAGNGRTMRAATAETLAQGGRLHGQLHGFRPEFLDRLTQAGLHLPVGLYRGDGLLGSMACHNLDPLREAWDGRRIVGAASAIYAIPQLSPLRPGDIRRQFRRKIRQMRGRLENAAISAIIYERGYQGLPAHADDMIAAYLSAHTPPATNLADRPFMALALRQHARARRPDPAELRPVPFDETGTG